MKDKSLIIVESPTKVKTISKFLGSDYEVLASVGHIRDLPKSKLGVDIEHDFRPDYVAIEGKSKIITKIKQAARNAKNIYLAPDPDREGEAIAWHIAEELKNHPNGIYRLMFNEITKAAVLKAIENPGHIDQNLVDAQQARRILDRLVGYKISPLLCKNVRQRLSAGRVQSVAVRMVCEREAEIEAFVTQEYWSITARLKTDLPPGDPVQPEFEAKLFKLGGKNVAVTDQELGERKFAIQNRALAEDLLKELQGETYKVIEIQRKEKKRSPAPPFITSSLQQEASRKLGFTAKKTMMLAQQLYEGIDTGSGPVGLITYMRTDSVRVAKEAQDEAREFIRGQWGKEYMPPSPPVYKTKKSAQDAHEAIRPTSISRTPESMGANLSKDQMALYRLIWQRYLASQMAPAILDTIRVDIQAGRGIFRVTGSTIKFAGFTQVYEEAKDEDKDNSEGQEAKLPKLTEEQILKLLELTPQQHFTQPPPRYTEASLVKALEENGIGRPSTYAAILSTIQARAYVDKEKGRFHPTELGRMVTKLLVHNFPEVLNIEFTAKMEGELDQVEEGQLNWVGLLKGFYNSFSQSLGEAESNMTEFKREVQKTEIPCPQCGQSLAVKWGKNGHFLACSGYPDCNYTTNFTRDEQGQIHLADSGAKKGEAEKTSLSCPLCQKELVVKHGRRGEFLACSGYPDCRFTSNFIRNEQGQIEIAKKPEMQMVHDKDCPKCGQKLVIKVGRYGQFLACPNYPKCKHTEKIVSTGEAVPKQKEQTPAPTDVTCPNCGSPMVMKRGRFGSFLSCSRYPECKTTQRM